MPLLQINSESEIGPYGGFHSLAQVEIKVGLCISRTKTHSSGNQLTKQGETGVTADRDKIEFKLFESRVLLKTESGYLRDAEVT